MAEEGLCQLASYGLLCDADARGHSNPCVRNRLVDIAKLDGRLPLNPSSSCAHVRWRARKVLAVNEIMEYRVIGVDEGKVYRRCGCRDGVTGRQVTGACGRMADPSHGRWYFAVQVSTLVGRRERVRRGGFPTEIAAERARQGFLTLADPISAGRVWTVRRWLEQWLAEQSDQVRSSTLRGYREHVRHYLIPLLGRFRLALLRTAQVQAAMRIVASGRTRSGRLLASSTLERIRATLRSAMAEAVRQGVDRGEPGGACPVAQAATGAAGGVDADP